MGTVYIWISLYLVRTYVLIENSGMYVLVRGVRTSSFLTPSFPAILMDDSFQTDLHKNDDRRRRRVAPIKMCRPSNLFFSFLILFRFSAIAFVVTNEGLSPPSRQTVAARMAEDSDDDELRGTTGQNVLGTDLIPCCTDVGGTGVGTGFYRNGYCSTGEQDLGRHTVCCQVTDEFLDFSKSAGNDLSTPMPDYLFPGLKDGDVWCLCAQRWAQAYKAGKAPKLFLQATHEKTLDYVPFEILKGFAIDGEEADEVLDDLNEMRAKLNKLL